MRVSIALILIFLIASCSLISPPVPPRAFSLESAMKLPFTGEVTTTEIDSFMDVEIGGMAVVHGRTVFYGFKFESPSDARKAFKRIISKHILKLRLIDTPWFGRFEMSEKGKKLIVWWKDVWMFAIEGDPGEVDELLESLIDTFTALSD